MDFFATAAKGTEPALRDELRELRFRGVRADRGGVHFAGPLEEGFRACLELRTAVRVLVKLAAFDAREAAELYDGVRAIEWEPFLGPAQTLAVRAACRSSQLTHTQFIAQKTKDAIVDRIRDREGARPSVDRDDPDVGVFVHVVRDVATVYADLSGESLHRRGYRARIGEAPLKETLAAAILRLGGWDRKVPLVDPMCGAGTIPIEGALWAGGVLPSREGRRFGFERWASHDEARAAAFQRLVESRSARASVEGPLVLGSDIDPDAVAAARANANAAGVQVAFSCRPLHDLSPTDPPGHVVTNPPYGERIAAAHGLYREMAAVLGRLEGHRVTILAGTPEIERAFRLRPEKRLSVWNGPIECRLLTYLIP